jgi:drug/metabolite transporter (DMT)-like permease
MAPAASLVALHVAVALFSFAGLFGKWLAISPTAIVFGRALVAGVVLALVVAWQKSGRARLTPGLAANGVVLAVHWVTFFAAIQASTVAIGLLGFASFPLFVLALEWLLRGRRWHAEEAAMALLAAAGLALLVPDFDLASRALRGMLLGVLSGFTFAVLAVRNRTLSVRYPASVLALWQNVVAALCLLPVLAWQRGAGAPVTVADLGLLLLLGVLCTALAHTLFIASMKRLSAHAASVVAALEPVYGMILAAWLLREWPDLRTCAGAALIVVAAMTVTWRSAPPPPA